jgi:hypothetical protein
MTSAFLASVIGSSAWEGATKKERIRLLARPARLAASRASAACRAAPGRFVTSAMLVGVPSQATLGGSIRRGLLSLALV